MRRNCVSQRGVAFGDEGDGPAVLLIHAFGLDSSMWAPQIEPLTERGFRVLTPDLRGFGESPGPGEGFDFSVVVDDMIGLLNDAGVPSAVVGGVSMGAATAVALATQHPDRVDGLLIADNSRPDGPERGAAAAQRIRTLGLEELSRVYEPILFGKRFRSSHPDVIDGWRQRLMARDPEHLATIVEPYHARPDPGPRLGDIRVPAALVFGEEDVAIPEDRRGDYLGIAGIDEHRIPDTGHISNLESPGAFTGILLGLLERVERSRRPADSEVPRP